MTRLAIGVFGLARCAAAVIAFAGAAACAQPAGGVLPISAEPNHKIRFDNGTVRMYEVALPRGKSTQFHEHTADSFSVVFNTSAMINENKGEQPVSTPVPAGFVGFTSTAKGPYTHRVEGNGDAPFRVMAIELLQPPLTANTPGAATRPSPPFTVARENARGRAYSVALGHGETTGTFVRAANTAILAISQGRITEHVEGRPPRLWDFEPGNFRWADTSERLSLKNESAERVVLVEVEIY